MDESLSEWLRLRESADWTARATGLVARVTAGLDPSDRIQVLDLCTGTGSNLRYLIDRLPQRQRWLVIDRDPALLAEVPSRLSSWAERRGCTVTTDAAGTHLRGEHLECDVETRRLNLETTGSWMFEGRHLVTASALLDLASERWLQMLAARCRAAGARALFTLTYDGRSSCDPPEPEDDLVRDLFNMHQKRDKGLGGPAAGPDASAAMERSFSRAGYLVETASSDWTIESGEATFQRRLIEGWAEAAAEMAPDREPAIMDWLRRRLTHVAAGASRIVVRHRDMAAWLVGE